MKTISDNIKSILAIIIVVLAFGYYYLVAFFGVVNDQITIAIVGILGVVVGYYFGSSQGSAKKQDTIDNLQNKAIADIGGSTPPVKTDEK
jgi:hypothetical protein